MNHEAHESMRKRPRLCFAQLFSHALMLFLFFSCNSSSDVFRLRGKFKNFNQGELYAYSLQGKGKIDTIRLSEGKFRYELPIEDDTIVLSVVFPNYSEIPVIAMPGTDVQMEGDASHLREVKVMGTDENKLLTDFRLRVADMTPPETVKAAAEFINEHPASPACVHLLYKYFLMSGEPDYRQVHRLLTAMAKAQPSNQRIAQALKLVAGLKETRKGLKLPKFSAVSLSGARVSNADLQGELNVIYVWSSWNYDSQSVQRQLRRLKKDFGSRLQLMGICLDGNPEDCKRQIDRDSIKWYTVCDGKMWQSPIVDRLGITSVPDMFIIDNKGTIVDRRLANVELESYIRKKMQGK